MEEVCCKIIEGQMMQEDWYRIDTLRSKNTLNLTIRKYNFL